MYLNRRSMTCLAIYIALAGCQKPVSQKAPVNQTIVTGDQYSEVVGRMTKEQVRSLLGDPLEVLEIDHMQGSPRHYKTTLWSYSGGEVNVGIEFYSSKVIRKSEEGLRLGDEEYSWWAH